MFDHTPVLLEESVKSLEIKPDGIYVDCTMGGGGHSRAIAERLTVGKANGKLICIDRDMDAIKNARVEMKHYIENNTIFIIHSNFSNIKDILQNLKIDKVDGILMDLGVSSYQLDTAERGFSYQHDAPLDMRMSQSDELTAYDIVNTYDRYELSKIISAYGEERYAMNIANRIDRTRSVKPIESTCELADIITGAIPSFNRRKSKHHPAKRTFQAIRIAVNDELNILKKAVTDSVECLNKDGIIAVITFHSLEDRIIKEVFNDMSRDCVCPPSFPTCICDAEAIVDIKKRKAIEPSESELEVNPRARSARLRTAKKL